MWEEENIYILHEITEFICSVVLVFDQGYIKRQALYACLTCVPEARTDKKKRAGVCLGCTYKCHDGHEFIELYTKRNFRCDCGTSKILSIRCKLDPMKMEDNEANTYNQNFSGVYCTCKRPYPDPEDTIDDVMIQCVLCEDWFHCRHLESKVPDVNAFEEMICAACTKRAHFLQYYAAQSVTADESAADDSMKEGDQSIVVDVVNDSAVSCTLDVTMPDTTGTDKTSTNESLNVKAVEPQTDKPNEDGTVDTEKPTEQNNTTDAADKAATAAAAPNTSETKASVNRIPHEEEVLEVVLDQCIRDIVEITQPGIDAEAEAEAQEPARKKLKLTVDNPIAGASTCGEPSKSAICVRPKTNTQPMTGSTYWTANWRKELCKCNDCMQLYKDLNVEYLIDLEDTVLFYQNKGISKMQEEGQSMADVSEMNVLGNMDHVARIEMVMGYNKLKEKLTEFLTSFIGSQRVVTVDDVNGFFQKMRESDDDKRNK